MNPVRRRWLLRLAALGSLAGGAAARAGNDPTADTVRRGRTLTFPRDHGAHPGARTEWWYATGWLGTEAAPALGFQLTFFRSRTGLAEGNPSRFAPRQLLFAHAAVSDIGLRRHLHDQRIERWSGSIEAGSARALLADTDVRVGDWSLRREAGEWRARLPSAGFALDLALTPTQPLLLQGDAGFSRKGPQEHQASHYYSAPQLATRGRVTLDGAVSERGGRSWIDHEWSNDILHPEAVGWDWVGINLFDGSALTAFVLRRADGSVLWAGGSWRAAGAPARSFQPEDLRMVPGRRWRSPASNASYPVHWQLQTPAGRFELRALMDAQELDSRGSTGTIYWEGLSELTDDQGRRVGLGYLEMTGYHAPLRL